MAIVEGITETYTLSYNYTISQKNTTIPVPANLKLYPIHAGYLINRLPYLVLR